MQAEQQANSAIGAVDAKLIQRSFRRRLERASAVRADGKRGLYEAHQRESDPADAVHAAVDGQKVFSDAGRNLVHEQALRPRSGRHGEVGFPAELR